MFDLQVPVLERFLLQDLGTHLLNFSDLFTGVHSSLLERVSHASRLADRVRNTIDQAEFCRQVMVLVSNLDQEKGLLWVRDTLPVVRLEVVLY